MNKFGEQRSPCLPARPRACPRTSPHQPVCESFAAPAVAVTVNPARRLACRASGGASGTAAVQLARAPMPARPAPWRTCVSTTIPTAGNREGIALRLRTTPNRTKRGRPPRAVMLGRAAMPGVAGDYQNFERTSRVVAVLPTRCAIAASFAKDREDFPVRCVRNDLLPRLVLRECSRHQDAS